MTRDAVADALDRAAEALAQAAHELRGTSPDAARASVPASLTAGPAVRAAGAPPPAPAARPQSDVDTSLCPKHGKPWSSGQYGEFCKSQTDDPAWGKEKVDRDGNKVFWCRITPKNAPQWVAINNKAPALDVDDIPF